MNKVKIEITGPSGSGKTTLAYTIKAVLMELGFDVAKVEDDGSTEMMDSLSPTELGNLLESRFEFLPQYNKIFISTKISTKKAK